MQSSRSTRLIAEYAAMRPGDLPAALAQRVAAQPRCAIARYLLACHCFDRGRAATAVRHLMVAHHVEPQLQSAALLVFAGLCWVERREAALLPVLLDTWEEFRRPAFDLLPRERRLLDAFAQPSDELVGAAPLAQRLWRLPIRMLRQQIRQALGAPGAAPYPLLTASA